MQIKIKRIDKSLPLPEYKTDGAAAFDLYVRNEETIKPHGFVMAPSNFIIKTPPGYMLMLAPRSSSAKKKGLNMRNGVAIIDQDYSGNTDEIHVLIQNLTDEIKIVERGERIAQGIFVKIDKAEWQEVDQMEGENRGGFGTTG